MFKVEIKGNDGELDSCIIEISGSIEHISSCVALTLKKIYDGVDDKTKPVFVRNMKELVNEELFTKNSEELDKACADIIRKKTEDLLKKLFKDD